MKDYMWVKKPKALDNLVVMPSNAPQRYEYHRLRMHAVYVRCQRPSGNHEVTVRCNEQDYPYALHRETGHQLHPQGTAGGGRWGAGRRMSPWRLCLQDWQLGS